MDYFSDKKEDYDIDLSDRMFGAKVFDNNVFFIDFGPVPPKPEFNANDFYLCTGDCLSCECYHCKLEGF